MKRIDKSVQKILSTKYKSWLDKNGNACNNSGYNYYYDDVVMNLYKCQMGVCAYTEMYICIPELYKNERWEKGRFVIKTPKLNRIDHLGELDHYDAEDKKVLYWNWNNLFMIHAKINGIKTNLKALAYLKPDTEGYSPEKYFEYDEITHRFIVHTSIKETDRISEIQNMIDKVLLLNHGVVRNERKNYINLIQSKKANGQDYKIDRFFTATNWCLQDSLPTHVP